MSVTEDTAPNMSQLVWEKGRRTDIFNAIVFHKKILVDWSIVEFHLSLRKIIQKTGYELHYVVAHRANLHNPVITS